MNAFFVRSDLDSRLPSLTAEQGWTPGQHRMPTDPDHYVPREVLNTERLRVIADLPVYDVITGATDTISHVFGLA